jgi:hypothetical protein
MPAPHVVQNATLRFLFRSGRCTGGFGRSSISRLVGTLTADQIEGSPAYVRRSELALVVIAKSMTKDAMHKRYLVEAERRGIERVAWVEDGSRLPWTPERVTDR